jgi:hypothetical protein
MKSSAISKTIEIISAVFILLFIYTAVSKLMTHQTFLNSLKGSPLLNFASPFLSWTVPAVEILIAAMLFTPNYREAGLFATFYLMVLFTIYIAYMLLAVSHLPCSCGGIISKLSWKQHLYLNTFFIVLAVTGIYFNKRLKFLLQ